jgi:20S proteasome subunit beta 3
MSSNPYSIHGGTVVAMKGKDCFCIANDTRLGDRTDTIASNVQKVHLVGDKLFVGLTGFSCDTATFVGKIKQAKTLYELEEDRQMKPKVLSTLVSNMLYKRRFGPYFMNTLVAGLDPISNKPFIVGTDSVGSGSEADFVCIGSGDEFGLATCETFWRSDLNAAQLTEATAQVMLGIIERDAATGWGAIIYTVTKDGITSRALKCRLD